MYYYIANTIFMLVNDKIVVAIYENSEICKLYDERIRTRGNRQED